MLVDIYNLELDFIQNVRYKIIELHYSCLEAILEYSEDKKIDLEMLAEIIQKNDEFKNLLEKEAKSLNFLKND